MTHVMHRAITYAMPLVVCLSIQASSIAQTATEGCSSGSARREATAAIPFRLLHPRAANAVRKVVDNPGIYRRLPVKAIDCHPEMLSYLIRNPEVVIEIWRKLGVSNLTMSRTGSNSFQASDGIGTVSQFQLIYGTPRVHVYYGTGCYEGHLLKKKVRARCVLLVRTAYRKTASGRHVATNFLDVFVDIENGAVNLAAKTLSPLFISSADTNVVATANFLSQLSYMAEMNPAKVKAIASELHEVNRDVRRGFSATVDRVAQSRKDQTQAIASDAAQSKPVDQVWYPVETQKPTRPRRSSATISRYPPDPMYR